MRDFSFKTGQSQANQGSWSLPLCVCVGVYVFLVTKLCDSLRSHGLQPTRLLYLWDFPGKNTGVGCHFVLQGIFLTPELSPHRLHLYH